MSPRQAPSSRSPGLCCEDSSESWPASQPATADRRIRKLYLDSSPSGHPEPHCEAQLSALRSSQPSVGQDTSCPRSGERFGVRANLATKLSSFNWKFRAVAGGFTPASLGGQTPRVRSHGDSWTHRDRYGRQSRHRRGDRPGPGRARVRGLVHVPASR